MRLISATYKHLFSSTHIFREKSLEENIAPRERQVVRYLYSSERERAVLQDRLYIHQTPSHAS